jgi:hypothetical protein
MSAQVDGQFQLRIDALREAAAGLRTNVSAAKADSSTETFAAVATSVTAVREALRDLGIVMSNTCEASTDQ